MSYKRRSQDDDGNRKKNLKIPSEQNGVWLD